MPKNFTGRNDLGLELEVRKVDQDRCCILWQPQRALNLSPLEINEFGNFLL